MRGPSTFSQRRFSGRDGVMLVGGLLIALLGVGIWTLVGQRDEDVAVESEETAATEKVSADELIVPADVLEVAGIEVTTVTLRPRTVRVEAPGVVQPNELQIQEVTPLVSGRIERVAVVEGSAVAPGTVLLTMSSPEVAELQGNLRAAEARLAEAEATLARTRRLVELGAGAGKDLVAAETVQRTAQAEVAQLRDRLEALGAPAETGAEAVASTVSVRAPAGATVLERLVNPGQWIQAGTPVMRLGNLSTVWVIVNAPEARLPGIAVGAPVEMRVAALDGMVVNGRVAYIEPELDTETRTAPVRVEVPNPGQRLRVGMFVQAVIEGRRTGDDELTIPSSAVQRIGERTVVFVPTHESGRFEVRDVELGVESQGSRVVLTGLSADERVVSSGGFTLKSQLLKGQFGEDEELGSEER